MKLSEKIAGIILIIFLLLGFLMLIIAPLSREISGMLLVTDIYVFCFGLVPMALYGLISLCWYLHTGKM